MTSSFSSLYRLFFTLSLTILIASHIQCASTKDTTKPDTSNEVQQSSTAKPDGMPQFYAEEFHKTCKLYEVKAYKILKCDGVAMTFQNVKKNTDAASTGDLQTMHQKVSKIYLDSITKASESTIAAQSPADAFFRLDSIHRSSKKSTL